MTKEADLLWTPRAEFARSSNLSKYMRWLAEERALSFSDYAELWQWSVSEIEAFWASVWDYFEVHSTEPYRQVLDSRVMPGGKWFEGARVNYAEHMLRHESRAAADKVVFHCAGEGQALTQMSWRELGRQVRILATWLRATGVVPGDRVVSYMPNTAETAIAMLATTSIGAVWSSASPEFGSQTVIDRFSQIEPKVLFAADGYHFGGKAVSREREVGEIVRQLHTIERVVWLPVLDNLNCSVALEHATSWHEALQGPDVAIELFQYEYVGHDHPLWIVFSSGTTGLPKAIVHNHVGVLLEHLKLVHFHLGLDANSVMFFYSTTGWMMWNVLMAALLAGAAVVLYDGSPSYPTMDRLWHLARDTGTTSFGASPTYIQIMAKHGIDPGADDDLSALQSVIVSGAPSTPETFAWLYQHVKSDLWVTSQSGGTELVSGFVGAVPTLPVYAGEIQARMLGMAVHAWNEDGEEVIDEVGELVVTKPFPSMPIRFWNDRGNARYHESYFDHFPGVWRHGDFIKVNQRGGCYIYGRSDATLNRNGIRIGTAEIYRTVEQIDAVADSLMVCCELPGGRFFMPLFVKLKGGRKLSDEIRRGIVEKLRFDCSPRHLPDQIYQVEAIPYTLTGKKMEIPVRKVLMGRPLAEVSSPDAMMDPAALDYFVRFAQASSDYDWRGATVDQAGAAAD